MIAAIVQPDARLPPVVCGEALSRSQAWVEDALEPGAVVVDRLLR